MERAPGIEPACLTWKDSALPLSYARDFGEELNLHPRHLARLFWGFAKIIQDVLIFTFSIDDPRDTKFLAFCLDADPPFRFHY